MEVWEFEYSENVLNLMLIKAVGTRAEALNTKRLMKTKVEGAEVYKKIMSIEWIYKMSKYTEIQYKATNGKTSKKKFDVHFAAERIIVK